MTGMSDDDLRAIASVVRSVVRQELAALFGKPTPDDLAKVSVALTDLGLRAVQQPVPVEVDNVVAIRPLAPVDPAHPPPSPPPSAA